MASHARGCVGGEQIGAVLQVPGERVAHLRQHEHQVHLHAEAAQLQRALRGVSAAHPVSDMRK